MQGIAKAVVAFTIKSLRSKPVDQQGFLRVALNGTFYTRDKLKHAGLCENDTCIWCEASGSISHLIWECTLSSDLVANMQRYIKETLAEAPACTTHHSWFVEPVELEPYLRLLPDISTSFSQVGSLFPVAHLFTDGSGWYPQDRVLHLATWAVVLANLPDDTCATLSHGPLPCVLQTVVRAELTAAISALEWVLKHDKPAVLWTDNLQVQTTLEGFRNGDTVCSNMDKDHDLWARARHLCTAAVVARNLLIKVVKVTAHEDTSQFSDADAILKIDRVFLSKVGRPVRRIKNEFQGFPLLTEE
jgi:ribonuclease HI